ncbi:hypothetical protein MPTK1_2g15170 [Marchantia polymorpha subsp. ruderalis]|uniref:Uncharacterized protein n=1 Tax=Marchantia polymorpha TaxID=3197 RepID=A0A2R6WJW9_MARPO|nr:hypothetical protein MARPO_0082s0013 [Marchantia polymorpha]BBN02414.1 hypothetical protein Mp_2g15170 [Marchantia polymorpha subsp. ruderalis]|eukprot:PTQ34157.1 hypothetical protein MARPO_0082s0013 [Marchantia polymorpha]
MKESHHELLYHMGVRTMMTVSPSWRRIRISKTAKERDVLDKTASFSNPCQPEHIKAFSAPGRSVRWFTDALFASIRMRLVYMDRMRLSAIL